jgi:hydrogenase expression/formation protein HypD
MSYISFLILKQLDYGKSKDPNEYKRAVREEGNIKAKNSLKSFLHHNQGMEGISPIPDSEWILKMNILISMLEKSLTLK